MDEISGELRAIYMVSSPACVHISVEHSHLKQSSPPFDYPIIDLEYELSDFHESFAFILYKLVKQLTIIILPLQFFYTKPPNFPSSLNITKPFVTAIF